MRAKGKFPNLQGTRKTRIKTSRPKVTRTTKSNSDPLFPFLRLRVTLNRNNKKNVKRKIQNRLNVLEKKKTKTDGARFDLGGFDLGLILFRAELTC